MAAALMHFASPGAARSKCRRADAHDWSAVQFCWSGVTCPDCLTHRPRRAGPAHVVCCKATADSGIYCKSPPGHPEALHRGAGYLWCPSCAVLVSVGRRGAFPHGPGCALGTSTDKPASVRIIPSDDGAARLVGRMAASLAFLYSAEVAA